MGFEKNQNQLLALAKSKFKNENALSELVTKAFLNVPRHLFVNCYRNFGSDEWLSVNDDNLEEHLSSLYADQPLILFGSDEDYYSKSGTKMISTISQPSFVLRLLDILQIKKGYKIFELGTASGWNAALMSHLVGDEGKVVTVEIIPELAESAKLKLKETGFNNVTVVTGDAGDGFIDEAPFDRAIFTAGAFDLPVAFHTQITVGGLLLFVLKTKGGADNLILLEKHENHFQSIYAMSCSFVPMTGKYHLPEMEEKSLDNILDSISVSKKSIQENNFWWGSDSSSSFLWQTGGLQSYLSLFENFVAIDLESSRDGHFGWIDKSSFAYASPGKIRLYGNKDAGNSLQSCINEWVKLGMPTLANLELSIFPTESFPDHNNEQNKKIWTSKRNQSTFVWNLPN